MSNLDFSMVKMAQENSAQYKRAQQNITESEIEKNIDLSNDEIEAIEKRFLDFSIQTDDKKKKKEIFGKLYVSKQDKENIKKRLKTAGKVAAALLIMYSVYKAGDIYSTVSTYNDVLEQKMENTLTEENINAYEHDHDNPILDGIVDYINIKDVEKELKASDDYDFFGNAVVHTDDQYLEFDEGSLYNLTERRQDAIDIVSDEVVEEYSSRIRRG